MKLSRIPGHEATVKHSFAFKQSTTALLVQYQEMYASHTGLDVSLKDVVEQMLLDFMAEDKAFQKQLKLRQDAPGATGAQATGAAAPKPGGEPSEPQVSAPATAPAAHSPSAI